jgi:SAM-dependent methyltransferase
MPSVESPDYWENSYRSGRLPWDLGIPAPALTTWLATHPGDGQRAFNPGCGMGHDAVAMTAAGYAVTANDFAASAAAATRLAADAAGLKLEVLQADLFTLTPENAGCYDLWVEHTCFCAIDPAMRKRYVEVAAALLKPAGCLFAVFFTHGESGGPPFDVQRAEIESLFSARFEIERLEPVTNSVPSRQGEETLAVFRRRI